MMGEQEFSRWIWAEGILREEICTSAEEDESTHVRPGHGTLTPEDQEGLLGQVGSRAECKEDRCVKDAE